MSTAGWRRRQAGPVRPAARRGRPRRGRSPPAAAQSRASGRWLVRRCRPMPCAPRHCSADGRAPQRSMPRGLVPAPDRSTSRCGGVRLASLLDPQTLATVAIAPPVAPSAVTDHAGRAGHRCGWRSSTGDAIVRVPSRPRAASPRASQVVGAGALTVDEIVARHQAAAARQAPRVRELISTGHADADVRGARLSRAGGDHVRGDHLPAGRARPSSSSATSASTASRSRRRRAAAADHRAGARRVAAARDHADRRLSLPSRGARRRSAAYAATSSLSSRRPHASAVLAAAPGLPRTASPWSRSSAAQTGAARADRLVGADRRVQPGTGRRLAARALGGPPAVRRGRLTARRSTGCCR